MLRFIAMRFILVIFLAGSFFRGYGQNLISNGDFADFKYCPYGFTQGKLKIVPGWTQPTSGTADYFNACSEKFGVPSNPMGWQSVVKGPGYIGLVVFSPNEPNSREYIQTKLSKALEANTDYCISWLLSLADYSRFMVDGFGVFVSRNRITGNTRKVLSVSPQISVPAGYLLQDTVDWIEVSAIYHASGGERYLTFGNFKSDAELTVKYRNIHPQAPAVAWDYAYYYLDHVSLVKTGTDSVDCHATIAKMEDELKEGTKPVPPVLNVIIRRRVPFEFDRYDLTDSAIAILDSVFEAMLKNKSYKLEVIGHTDNVGGEIYNDKLSEKRAKQVLEFLALRGIDRSRLAIAWQGEKQPLTENTTIEGRRKNRRVEFRVYEWSYSDYSP